MDPKEDTTQNNAAEEEAPISQDENSKSQSSAADLAARREARRRKILENSNNRLTKLTGREHKDAPQFEESYNTLYPDPELERDIFSGGAGIIGGPGTGTSQGGGSPTDASIISLLAAFAGLGDTGGGGFLTILALVLRTRIQYRILAVIVYILFANGIVTNNILVPLLCWEVNEVFLLKTYVPKLNILTMLFTISGVAPNYVPTLTKIIETIHKIAKDVALFMYCFLVTHFVFCKVWLGQDLQTIFYSVLEKKADYVAT